MNADVRDGEITDGQAVRCDAEAHAGRPSSGLRPASRREHDIAETVIDGDVSTVSAMADKVLRIEESQPWLLHFEFQASYEPDLPRRMLQYNVLLNSRHDVPVQSTVVLLRREADGPEVTGTLRRTLPDGRLYLEFRYHAIRIWQTPVEHLLQGGVGTLPLAPISVTKTEAPGVIQRMRERLSTEVTPPQAATLWTETKILLGLRYDSRVAAELLRGVQSMKESSTYMEIIEEGEALGIQKVLLLQGKKRFGPPDAATQTAIQSITDLSRLESLTGRLLDVTSWQELLSKPASKRRTGRKGKS
jgi:predicted transposase YdaD